ncbi:hypothetical protein TREES_T100013921 [Tupaia chinensis]|uniref:Uncharacterized protein n=1 Tax=Tupaia chinensis TaxID=246437 RepID=L9KUQ7_TUPCH|nr:hypothetical protein TREES_T100013921 [Tupaia chinensis]
MGVESLTTFMWQARGPYQSLEREGGSGGGAALVPSSGLLGQSHGLGGGAWNDYLQGYARPGCGMSGVVPRVVIQRSKVHTSAHQTRQMYEEQVTRKGLL